MTRRAFIILAAPVTSSASAADLERDVNLILKEYQATAVRLSVAKVSFSQTAYRKANAHADEGVSGIAKATIYHDTNRWKVTWNQTVFRQVDAKEIPSTTELILDDIWSGGKVQKSQ